MSCLSLKTLSHSFSSSSIFKTISVPLPSVFPLGSGKTWNSSPEEVDTKVYCSGFGFWAVGGGREDTRTVLETRKLDISSKTSFRNVHLTNYRNQDLTISAMPGQATYHVPNCPIRFPSAPPFSSAFFKNSPVPDRAIVPKFFANSSLVIPIPVSDL
jgi:hypothetical protein